MANRSELKFWHSQFDASEIDLCMSKIREVRRFSKDGDITLSAFGALERWEVILTSAIDLDLPTDAMRSAIIRKVLLSKELRADFTEKEFRGIAHRVRNDLLRKDPLAFRVVFPIWNRPEFLKGIMRAGEVTLNFTPSRSSKSFKVIENQRKSQRTSDEFRFFFTAERVADISKCDVCIAFVNAISAVDANERASEAMYQVMGLLNIVRDSNKNWRSSSRSQGKLPVSEVLIAPHTTVHHGNGMMAYNGFWSENWVGGPSHSKRSTEQLGVWRKNFQRLCGALRKSKWPEQSKSAAVGYFKAFSNPALEEAFLDGWRLFENITGEQLERIETKIVRAANVFQENTEYKLIGRHLALRRNLISHGRPIKVDDSETLAFQMRELVGPYTERFILNGFSFSSLKEFWEFLDLPAAKHERVQLRSHYKRRLSMLDKAVIFRNEND